MMLDKQNKEGQHKMTQKDEEEKGRSKSKDGDNENDHFFGKKAFEIMESLTREQLEPFICLVEGVDLSGIDYPWLKEYKRYLKKHKHKDL